MSNSTPEIPGYQLDQRILQHPLAELWQLKWSNKFKPTTVTIPGA